MQVALGGLDDGIRLAASHHYRLTGRCDNLTGGTLAQSAMAHMAMLCAPAHLDQWSGLSPIATITTVIARGAMDGMAMKAARAHPADH